MKIWQKVLSIALVVVVIVSALLVANESSHCVICESFRYHAPCLVDLEEGALIELDIYFPHELLVAELADPQPEQSTFSFVKLGDALGYRDTGSKRIEVEIPSSKVTEVTLCRECKSHLNSLLIYDRYVLVDLYDADNKVIIPIAEGLDVDVRCYEIKVTKEENSLKLIVQGNLN